MDSTTVYTSVNSASVHIINFVNPLQVSVRISVVLQGKDSNFFFLLHKKLSHIILKRGGSVDIPVMFAPEKMYKHEVTVIIIANTMCDEKDSDGQNLQWDYPIYGQPEIMLSSHGNAPKIVCRAKLQMEQMISAILVKSLRNSTEVYFNKPGRLLNLL